MDYRLKIFHVIIGMVGRNQISIPNYNQKSMKVRGDMQNLSLSLMRFSGRVKKKMLMTSQNPCPTYTPSRNIKYLGTEIIPVTKLDNQSKVLFRERTLY
jgi:hypothetical protein